MITLVLLLPTILFAQNRMNPEDSIRVMTQVYTSEHGQSVRHYHYDRKGLLKISEAIDTSINSHPFDTLIQSKISIYSYFSNDSVQSIEHLELENASLKKRMVESFYYGQEHVLDSIIEITDYYSKYERTTDISKTIYLRPRSQMLIERRIINDFTIDSTISYLSKGRVDSVHHFHQVISRNESYKYDNEGFIFYLKEYLTYDDFKDSSITQYSYDMSIYDLRIAWSPILDNRITHGIETERIYYDSNHVINLIIRQSEVPRTKREITVKFANGLPFRKDTIRDGVITNTEEYRYTKYR